MIDATAPVQNESQRSTAQHRTARRHGQQVPTHVILVILAVALFLGVVVPLVNEFSIYLPIGLAMVLLLGLLGLAAFRIAVKLSLATLALASSLLWFAIFEFLASARPHWIWTNRGLVLRMQGIGAALFILPLAVLVLLRPPPLHKVREINLLEFILAISVILNGFTMAIGILRGNSIGYVLGDTYKFMVIPIVYLVCVTMITKPQQRGFVWKLMVVSGILIGTAGIVIQFCKHALGWVGIGGDIDIFALTVSVLLYVSSPNKRVRFVALLATVALVVGAVVSLERRNLLFVILVWTFVMVLKKGKSRYRLVRLTLVGCVLLFVALLVLNLALPDALSEMATRVQGRYESTFRLGEEHPSFARRLDELEIIVQELRQESPIYSLIGLGQGAEFPYYRTLADGTPVSYDNFKSPGSRLGLVHTVHNTYVSVLFRMGILGFFLIAGFAVLSLKLAYDCVRYAQKQESFLKHLFLQASLIYLLVSFIADWNVWPRIGEIPLAVVVGLLASTMRWQLRSDSL